MQYDYDTAVRAIEKVAELEAENAKLLAEVERLKQLCDTERADAERFLDSADSLLDGNGDLDFDIILDNIGALKSRLDIAHRDTRCPECGCRDHIDAEAQECGCDCIVCAHDGSETLAELAARLYAEHAKLRDACEAAFPVVEQRNRLNQSRGSVNALHLLTAALRGESEVK